jgi:hypothetical protein
MTCHLAVLNPNFYLLYNMDMKHALSLLSAFTFVDASCPCGAVTASWLRAAYTAVIFNGFCCSAAGASSY